jgi:TRAP-type C4-dicarboxylate transport system substrate-binding protein
MKGLAPDHAKVLTESAKKAHSTLVDQVSKEDEKAYKTLISRGIKEFDVLASPDQKKAWDDLYAEMIKRLTGKLWTKELLDRVRAAAAEVK